MRGCSTHPAREERRYERTPSACLQRPSHGVGAGGSHAYPTPLTGAFARQTLHALHTPQRCGLPHPPVHSLHPLRLMFVSRRPAHRGRAYPFAEPTGTSNAAPNDSSKAGCTCSLLTRAANHAKVCLAQKPCRKTFSVFVRSAAAGSRSWVLWFLCWAWNGAEKALCVAINDCLDRYASEKTSLMAQQARVVQCSPSTGLTEETSVQMPFAE